MQYGFTPVVLPETVGDRDLDAHEANLYDIDTKYGGVTSAEEILEYLEEKDAARVH